MGEGWHRWSAPGKDVCAPSPTRRTAGIVGSSFGTTPAPVDLATRSSTRGCFRLSPRCACHRSRTNSPAGGLKRPSPAGRERTDDHDAWGAIVRDDKRSHIERRLAVRRRLGTPGYGKSLRQRGDRPTRVPRTY